MPTSFSTTPTSRALAQKIADMGQNEEDDPTLEDITEFTDSLSPETIALLRDGLDGHTSSEVQHVVTDLIYEDHSKTKTKEAKLREFLTLIDEHERQDISMNLALIEGLHCMPTIRQYRDMSMAEPEDLALYKALIKVGRAAVTLHEERGVRVHDQIGVVFITDPNVISLVKKNVDKADQIASIILENQQLKADYLADKLSIIPPLRTGSL